MEIRNMLSKTRGRLVILVIQSKSLGHMWEKKKKLRRLYPRDKQKSNLQMMDLDMKLRFPSKAWKVWPGFFLLLIVNKTLEEKD